MERSRRLGAAVWLVTTNQVVLMFGSTAAVTVLPATILAVAILLRSIDGSSTR